MTTPFLNCAAALAAGVVLGLVYFAGLWYTVRNLLNARRPALWTAVSFALRAGFCMMGFFWLADGGWQLVLAALAGFLLVRQVMIRRLKAERRHFGA
jgi:F1F0 ATPase subunit 2